MNSYERILTSLCREEPDRIPIMEMIFDPRIINILGFQDYFELVDKLELDAVMVGGQQQSFKTNDIRIWGEQRRVYVNDWGVTMCCSGEVVDVPIDYPVKYIEDFIKYNPPNPRENKILTYLPELVKRYKGKKAIVVSIREVFGNSWNIRGMENYLVDYILNPDLAIEIARKVTDYAIEIHSLLIKIGRAHV